MFEVVKATTGSVKEVIISRFPLRRSFLQPGVTVVYIFVCGIAPPKRPSLCMKAKQVHGMDVLIKISVEMLHHNLEAGPPQLFHLASRICCCFRSCQQAIELLHCRATHPVLFAVSICSRRTSQSAPTLLRPNQKFCLMYSLEEVLTHVSISVVPCHTFYAFVGRFLTWIIVF